MQHERQVRIKQESGLYKKWEGNQFLEQETLTLPWDMSTIQVELYVQVVISNTKHSLEVEVEGCNSQRQLFKEQAL